MLAAAPMDRQIARASQPHVSPTATFTHSTELASPRASQLEFSAAAPSGLATGMDRIQGPTLEALARVVDRPHAGRFRGRGEDLLGLTLANVVLSVLTGGFYLPWAMSRRRKFFVNNSQFAGRACIDRSSGSEAFMRQVYLGYAVLAVLGVVLLSYQLGNFVGVLIVALVLGVSTLLAFPLWQYRRVQRRCAATSWGEVELELVDAGRSLYIKRWLIGGLLSSMSLGIMHPLSRLRSWATIIDHVRVGDQELFFEIDEPAALSLGLRGLLLHVLTLGIYNSWYRAHLMRQCAAGVRCAQFSLAFELRGGQLFGLDLAMVLGSVLSLGLARPWLMCRRREVLLAALRVRHFTGHVAA